MNERKLKIEVHPSNKNVGLNYSKTSTVANLKNIKIFKNLHKAKLEDRHRIKGISFSTHKKEYNNLLLYKLKKKDEATTFELSEANFLRSINDYNLLKHEIYLKELKEKKVKTKEAIFNEKIIKKDINYTFLRETIYQFMRSKKSHNKYNSNLLKNKDEIKRAKKISKSNFINKTLKNVSQHFHQITGKIDMGVRYHEEILNEKEYDNLIEQISKSRKRHLKSFQGDLNVVPLIDNKSNINLKTEPHSFNSVKPKKSQQYNFSNKFFSYFQDIIPDINKEEENKNENKLILNLANNQEVDEEENEEDENNTENINIMCKTETDLNNKNKYIINKSKRLSSSRRNKYYNLNNNDNQKNNNRVKTSKFKTSILNNPIKLNEHLKTNIYDIQENDKDSISSITEKSNKLNVKYKNKEESYKSKYNNLLDKDLINLEQIKQNNNIKEKINFKYWNNNIRRINTAGNRNLKVINKPLYVSKISDFIKEFKRIKSASKKVKKRMREEHLTTLDNIEKICKIKEDLLMFVLKMKYFHNSFPPKKVKTKSKKEHFVKKLTNYLAIIDNPYSITTKELKSELKNQRPEII